MRVANWSTWQSYRSDRGQPPWIKVHRRVLRNPEWVALSDSQRGQLVSMWILAADKDGELPDDPKVIQKLCYLDSEPDLQVFVAHGFLEKWRQGDVTTTPEGRQRDRPEAEAESETEKKRSIGDRKKTSRQTSLPSDWQPNDSHRQRADEYGLSLASQAELFRLHAEEKGRKAQSWNAAFTRWLMNAKEYARPAGRSDRPERPRLRV